MNVHITARLCSGAALATVAVNTDITIAELKAEITKKAELDPGVCLQQLCFNGMCLKDTASLEESGLGDGDDVVPICGRALDGEFIKPYCCSCFPDPCSVAPTPRAVFSTDGTLSFQAKFFSRDEPRQQMQPQHFRYFVTDVQQMDV